jgi:hypothetical protein
MTGVTRREGVPPLCEHFDPSECTEECREMARKFDEWLRGELKREGDGNANPDKTDR